MPEAATSPPGKPRRRLSAQAVRHAAWAGFRMLARGHVHWPLLTLFARVISERQPNGHYRPAAHSAADGRPTVLALSPEEFRGDLQFLAETGQVRLLEVPDVWLRRLMFQFFPIDRDGDVLYRFVKPAPGAPHYREKQTYRKFLRRFLPKLYAHLGVDCVITHHIHNIPAVDWGEVSQSLGVPYLVFHRECLHAAPRIVRHIKERVAPLAPFAGEHIAVHNEAARSTFIDCGYCRPDQISSLGAVRMDSYLARVAEDQGPPSGRQTVALFGFTIGRDIGKRLHAFTDIVHLAFAELAQRHPDVDFVIKYKKQYETSWLRQFHAALAQRGLDVRELTNLQVTADRDAQELIMASSAVCGFNSTTLLEAALAGRKVVIPYFPELKADGVTDYILFHDYYDAFDLAETPQKFQEMLEVGLRPYEIPAAVMARRREVFARYLGDLDGDATRRYAELVRTTVGHSQTHGRSPDLPKASYSTAG